MFTIGWVVATAGRFPSPARSQLVSWFAMEQTPAMQCSMAGVSAATQPGEVWQMSSTAQPLFLDQQLYSFSDAWKSTEIPYACVFDHDNDKMIVSRVRFVGCKDVGQFVHSVKESSNL